MLGSIVALIGCVLTLVALGMPPSTYRAPLNTLRLSALPRPKIYLGLISLICVMGGAALSLIPL